MVVQFNRDDVLDWKSNLVTKAFIETIKEDKDNIIASWAGGNYTDASAEGTVQLNAEALGNLRAIENILNTLGEYEETFDYEGAE